MNFNAPHIDYAGLSPVIALTAGLVLVLMVGLLPFSRWVSASATLAVLAAAAGLSIWQWGSETDLVAGALRLDAFGLAAALISMLAAAEGTGLSIREPAPAEANQGAFYSLLLRPVLGLTPTAHA